MTPISESQCRQLGELNAEYRDINEAINHAQADVDRAKKLYDMNYHRRRKAILSATSSANGHDENQ